MARTTDNASASATSANSSITNVAALANVSIATVSRVLSGKRTKADHDFHGCVFVAAVADGAHYRKGYPVGSTNLTHGAALAA